MAAHVRGWKKTTQPEKLARVEEVVRIVLCGGELPDIRQYAEEKGWNVKDPTLWQYKRLAFALIKRRTDRNRAALIDRHLASRRLMLARAMEAGDIRTALAIEQDTARLQGLYPEPTRKHEITGPNGGPIISVTARQMLLEIDEYAAEFRIAARAERLEKEQTTVSREDLADAGCREPALPMPDPPQVEVVFQDPPVTTPADAQNEAEAIEPRPRDHGGLFVKR